MHVVHADADNGRRRLEPLWVAQSAHRIEIARLAVLAHRGAGELVHTYPFADWKKCWRFIWTVRF